MRSAAEMARQAPVRHPSMLHTKPNTIQGTQCELNAHTWSERLQFEECRLVAKCSTAHTSNKNKSQAGERKRCSKYSEGGQEKQAEQGWHLLYALTQSAG